MAWLDLTQAERDAAYDNAAAVPASAGRIAAWAAASADLRARRPEHLDISYGPRPRNKWDLYPGKPGAPGLVFIHGGYWLRNSRETLACMAEGVLANGWSAALPGYTLAPDATLAEIVAEIGTALGWLEEHRHGYGIDGPIILSGWSAGGHLAAMMLAHPVVTAGLAISGIFDIEPLRGTAYNNTLRLTAIDAQMLSPMRLPMVRKPLTLAYGTNELPALVANSCAFHALRAGSNAKGPLLPLAGHDHFSILEELRTPDGKLTQELCAAGQAG